MPFDTFTLELAFFLSLVSVLASLPPDPYSSPWRDGFPGTSRPLPPRLRTQGFPVAGFPSYGPPPQERWHQLEGRAGGRNSPSHQLTKLGNGGQLVFRRRSSETLPEQEPSGAAGFQNDNFGFQALGHSYSSHVNCEADKRGGESEKNNFKNVRENFEPVYGSEGPASADEKINFEETSRNVRNGNSKEIAVHNPRIVTPKGGRRPSHGSPVKNQSKPLGLGGTNAISTTEKSWRNQTTKGSKRPPANGPKPSGGDIVFPDGYPKKFVPRVTKCAKTRTFCEHLGDEYPSDYINQVLKKEGATFREFFGKDVIADPNITERINAPEENSLCPYRQEVVFPRAAQNKEDKWLFIVNQDQYVQGVTVEVCLNPESRCSLTEGFPLGYMPYCKQKYIERRLVAIGEDGKPHSDSFRLPSCCSCVVKHETSARMAAVRAPRNLPAAPPR